MSWRHGQVNVPFQQAQEINTGSRVTHQGPASAAGITQQVAAPLKSTELLLLMPSSLLDAERWWSDQPCSHHSGKPSSLALGVVLWKADLQIPGMFSQIFCGASPTHQTVSSGEQSEFLVWLHQFQRKGGIIFLLPSEVAPIRCFVRCFSDSITLDICAWLICVHNSFLKTFLPVPCPVGTTYIFCSWICLLHIWLNWNTYSAAILVSAKFTKKLQSCPFWWPLLTIFHPSNFSMTDFSNRF